MKTVSNILVVLGLIVLCMTAVFRFFLGSPFLLLGVRSLSLLIIANTLFLLAIIARPCEKK